MGKTLFIIGDNKTASLKSSVTAIVDKQKKTVGTAVLKLKA